MEHINNGEQAPKPKRGRPPKGDILKYRHMIRLNDADSKRLLAMYRQSKMKSMSRFMANRVLNNPPKVIEINKPAIDFVILLTRFFSQFRGVKNNYNQLFAVLNRTLGEEKARSMIQIVAPSTREFGLLKREFEEQVTKLREQISNP